MYSPNNGPVIIRLAVLDHTNLGVVADSGVDGVAIERTSVSIPFVISDRNRCLPLVLVDVLVSLCSGIGVAAAFAIVENDFLVLTNWSVIIGERVIRVGFSDDLPHDLDDVRVSWVSDVFLFHTPYLMM